MAVITVEEHQEFPTLPAESILHLKVVSTETKDVTGKTKDSAWTKLEFKFKILGIQIVGDGSPAENYDALIGQHIWGSVPYRLTDSPENKLKQWAEAIFGMELGVGFQLDTELFNNKQVRGVTNTYDKKNINPRTGQPFKNHQVSSLLPVGGGMPPQSASASGWDAPAAVANTGPLVAPPVTPAPMLDNPPPQPATVPAAPQPLADPWDSAPPPSDPTGGWGDVPPF